ncbi:MAG TPA: phenylalanine--tRNA ligase subunit beta, partial [Tepidisphaeraceae bacterium]|nr:phenylalanine--tRNA ligase subunit beta [Tepidisphaeraceae bacterium]
CLTHIGVARELAALLNRSFKEPQASVNESDPAASTATRVQIDALSLCPHYSARILKNITIGPSPDWMQRRLAAVGLRPINNVVDVTNYVLFEMGQPLHAFDYDKLKDHRIIVRNAKPGETLTSIDGHARRLEPDMLVIADANRAVALAGVMGGRDSEVTDTTVNVLLESARFDPLSVRKTARALAMKSDSSYRFERGIDPSLPLRASLRAAQLIQQTAGGQVLRGVAEAGKVDAAPKKLSLRLARLKQILGVDIPPAQAIDALKRLRLSPVQSGERIDATVPSDRLDINIEVDLVEEVARVIGYDKIPVRDEISIRVAPPEPAQRTIEQIRTVLTAGGYFEAITVSFISDSLAGDFLPPGAHSLPRADAAVRKADAMLRPSLIPGLLESVRRNESVGTSGAKLFELGSAFFNDATMKLVERRQLTVVGSSDLREVRGVIEALLKRLSADTSIRVVPDEHRGFSSAGRIEWDGKAIGYIGKVDKVIAEKIGLREIPAAAEVELLPLLAGAQHVPQLHALPRYPSVRRDISLVVPESLAFEKLEQLIRGVRPEHLEDLEYVTTYRGKPLEKGTKSVTVSLIFRSPTTTLTSEQVESSVKAVVDAATSQLGATLRV